MTDCERCDGQGEVFDRKDFWGNDLTVQCPACSGTGRQHIVGVFHERLRWRVRCTCGFRKKSRHEGLAIMAAQLHGDEHA